MACACVSVSVTVAVERIVCVSYTAILVGDIFYYCSVIETLFPSNRSLLRENILSLDI